jgi:hypothetical protein
MTSMRTPRRRLYLLGPILAGALAGATVDAQKSPVQQRGNYCFADLSMEGSQFRAVINTYRTPQGVLVFEVKRRQAADTFINETASFAVGLDYAVLALLDEAAVNSPKNYLLRNRKYTLGSEMTASELKLARDVRKACPLKR